MIHTSPPSPLLPPLPFHTRCTGWPSLMMQAGSDAGDLQSRLASLEQLLEALTGQAGADKLRAEETLAAELARLGKDWAAKAEQNVCFSAVATCGATHMTRVG